jgi:hypothetical protein
MKMNKLIKSFVWLMLLALLIVPVVPAYAQSGQPGKIIFGDNYTLAKGDKLNGDLVVFGGNVTIEDDADLNGNLVVFGGTISSNGNVSGDVVVFGGQIKLDDKAVVSGDVVTIGGQLDKAESAVIKGKSVNNVSPNIELPNGTMPPVVKPPSINVDFNPFWQALGVFYRAVIVAALAMLVVTFLQPQMERVGQAIVRQPVMAGGMGLLTVLGGPIAIAVAAVIMIITLILIPVAVLVVLLGGLAFALAWLFGVIALGHEVGERFTQSVNQNWAPVFTTGFGTFLVMLVGGAIGQIPCVGWLLTIGIGLVAIGAVVMTRFGMQPMSVAAPTYTPPTTTGQLPPAS